VLREAQDERTPLLERLKFLAIFSSNLDEFYQVRVAGLRRQVAAGVVSAPPDGLTAQEQLDAIDKRVRALAAGVLVCLHDQLLPALAERGIRLVSMNELTAVVERAGHLAAGDNPHSTVNLIADFLDEGEGRG
jgi:polyphosphate kinase